MAPAGYPMRPNVEGNVGGAGPDDSQIGMGQGAEQIGDRVGGITTVRECDEDLFSVFCFL